MNDCTIIYDTSNISNCDDFYVPKLITILTIQLNLITIIYQLMIMCIMCTMWIMCINRMIIKSYLYRRLYDHLHSQNKYVNHCSDDPIIVKTTSVI